MTTSNTYKKLVMMSTSALIKLAAKGGMQKDTATELANLLDARIPKSN